MRRVTAEKEEEEKEEGRCRKEEKERGLLGEEDRQKRTGRRGAAVSGYFLTRLNEAG